MESTGFEDIGYSDAQRCGGGGWGHFIRLLCSSQIIPPAGNPTPTPRSTPSQLVQVHLLESHLHLSRCIWSSAAFSGGISAASLPQTSLVSRPSPSKMTEQLHLCHKPHLSAPRCPPYCGPPGLGKPPLQHCSFGKVSLNPASSASAGLAREQGPEGAQVG